jgi:hypothetical protein
MSRFEDGRFAPGVSGNPGGRPKVPDEVKEMLHALTPEAVRALADTLNGCDERLRFLAAQEVLNRSLGRPHQSSAVEVTSHKSINQLHLEALAAHNEQFRLPVKVEN